MFDIKPVDETGRLDVETIAAVKPVVDLRSSQHPTSIGRQVSRHSDDFESLLNEVDLEIELANVGAISHLQPGKPRHRIIKKPQLVRVLKRLLPPESSVSPATYEAIVSEIHRSAADAARADVPSTPPRPPSADISGLPAFYTAPAVSNFKKIKKPLFRLSQPRWTFMHRQSLVFCGAALCAFVLVWYGLKVKAQILRESSFAVENLTDARESLKAMDFEGASDDFLKAYDNFAKVGDNLNFMGATFSVIIAELPGAGTVKSARNLIEVGQLLSDAGSAMATAMAGTAKTGALSDPSKPNLPIGAIVGALKEALNISKRDVTKAAGLLTAVDGSIVPEDKKAGFDELKAQLPIFEKLVVESADYAKFFEDLIGPPADGGERRYLVLFENASELRPAGGFPGTYATVTFKDGKLAELFVDDIYNLDGQLKENIVPPAQLRHITPNWAMRDANWFIDFPTSARKIREFYKKESGKDIDGVVAVNPRVIAAILSVTGPVELPQYGLTLKADNVLTAIQEEVEYGPNRSQPKQVVKDFASALLTKIYDSPSDQWLTVFNALVAGMDRNDILMHFNDLNLEGFVTTKDFSGQVEQTAGDYLMPVISNIKGSKTDAVTVNTISVTTELEGDDAIHAVTLTRRHNGGKTKYGFYNKQNSAYIRLLVPEGSELLSVSGNDNPNFSPLMDYRSAGFTEDKDLRKFETNSYTDIKTGVTIYQEAGKREFGFWLLTDAGTTRAVTLKYRVPDALKGKSYELYIQKQPGMEVKNLELSLVRPAGLVAAESHPLLARTTAGYNWSGLFLDDLTLKVNFK